MYALNYADNYKGIQWAIINYTTGDFLGWQGGFVNYTGGSMKGLQSGAVNCAGTLTGLQFGPVNYAEAGQTGVQIGPINLIPLKPMVQRTSGRTGARNNLRQLAVLAAGFRSPAAGFARVRFLFL
jgi:hypothetical protein